MIAPPTDYRLDAEETGACGVPCMREAGNPDAPLLKYDATLPDGRTVWGHVFRVTRIARGLTIRAAADAVGVISRTVDRWEAGEVTPAPGPARRYWRALQSATPPPETLGPRRGPRPR